MAKKRKAGRKKKIDTAEWKNFSILLPEELWRALRHYCFEKEIHRAELIRELVERHLEKKGRVKVKVARDKTGREIRSYETLS